MQRPISIVITDDHPLAVSGITALLQPFEDIVIKASYATGNALLAGLKTDKPDVLLLDIMLPDISGQELATKIIKSHPGVNILVLSSLDAPAIVSAMMRKGCKGYLLKGADQHMLHSAIHEVYKGEIFLEPSLKEHLVKQLTGFKKSGISSPPDISRREKEILTLIVAECTTQEIADKLFISYRTVENHRYSLLQKLDVKNTAGLVRLALQLGIVE